MAFPDPITVVIDGDSTTLQRTSFGKDSGTFKSSDSSVTMSIAHQYGKRTRRTIRLDGRKIAPDPLQPATNAPYSASVYLVVDAPPFGYSVSDLEVTVNAFVDFLTTSSGANVTKLLGGEA